ncbi:flavin-containing monooxygenase [Microbacterium protaetiae]|nr:NAD(P)/FAD-dependent oxidoreductase [Microbacterium protaetiae]
MTNDCTSTTPDYDAIVVGAGLSGIYAVHRLQQRGFTVRAFERGSGVGGTWFWNRYPGLQCDTETLSYSFTFSDELYRGWNWSRRFAPQSELMAYANYMTDALGVRDAIQLNTAVLGAHFDDDANLWRVDLDTGQSVTGRYFVAASGPLSTTNSPTIAGLDTFEGTVLHTAQWPFEPVDFTGKKVGVVGTGSSGAQLITALAGTVDKLVVFQRTPQYVTPAQQRPLGEEEVRERKDNLDDLRALMRSSSHGAPGTGTDRSAFDDTPEERDRVFQAAWEFGAQAFALATYNDLTSNEEANGFAADFVRRKIAEIVDDPETARKLMPTYLFGTKRPIKVDDYYETFNRPNVQLVALREEPFVSATTTGIRTTAADYDLDYLIFATGFDAMTGTLFEMDIRGRDGLTLRDKWENGVYVRTALGVAMHEFPNMFLVQGPQSTTIMNNYTLGIEINMDFIAGLLERARAEGNELIEATAQSEVEWAELCQTLAERTLLLKTESWWTGANIAGKPRPKLFQSYTGGLKQYRLALERAQADGYREFERTPVQTAVLADA